MELRSETVLVLGATGNAGPNVTDQFVDQGAAAADRTLAESLDAELAARVADRVVQTTGGQSVVES
ncbi:hypothetical protein KTS45_17455 [Halomicroarcula limicola]|uniref:Uncharacterized protein n=1 Tax=Haloarcula limicola TaxID=1429915 RepID=A0A8J8C8E4_9EURY|nr:hypothetical protein [Halomicroarcula limicola]MBV0925993.1 hypothetical protein [Halomicroarcula limicola]